MKKIIAILAILFTTLYTGHLLNIGLTYGGYWQSVTPTVFMEDFKEKTSFISALSYVLIIPSILAMVLSIFLRKDTKRIRNKWIVGLACLLLIILITILYHIPTNTAFVSMVYNNEGATSKLNTWMYLHWVRTALALFASVIAILAFQGEVLERYKRKHE